MSIRRLLPVAALSLATAATPVLAQTVDEQVTMLVGFWITEQGARLYPEVQDYGIACLTPVVLAAPPRVKEFLIAAGGMEAGLAQLQADDVRRYDDLYPGIQQCIETMLVGQPIWDWVEEAEAAAGAEAQRIAAYCVMDAISELPSAAKQLLFQAAAAEGADFEDALDALVAADPALEEPLQAGIEPCL